MTCCQTWAFHKVFNVHNGQYKLKDCVEWNKTKRFWFIAQDAMLNGKYIREQAIHLETEHFERKWKQRFIILHFNSDLYLLLSLKYIGSNGI